MFFGKKKIETKYITYMTKVMKYKNVLEIIRNDKQSKQVLILYFFEQTRDEMSQLLDVVGIKNHDITTGFTLCDGVNFLSAHDIRDNELPNASSLFCLEVHPLYSINQVVIAKAMEAKLKEIIFYTGMDEITMLAFGSGKIAGILSKMGVKEDEALEHSMITKSIQNGQEKIEYKIYNPKDIRISPELWAEENNLEEAMN